MMVVFSGIFAAGSVWMIFEGDFLGWIGTVLFGFGFLSSLWELIWPGVPSEQLTIVQLSDSGVSCTRPGGLREEVDWSDLQRVEIMTTDTGPYLTDVFWVLHGTRSGCVVPQGASGEKELVERLQALPGFRNQAVIEAMSCTQNQSFLCWEKPSK